MSEWISVEDRLPEITDKFIGCDSDGGVYECCRWCEGEIISTYMMGKYGANAKPTDKITHWMPLPEPPK